MLSGSETSSESHPAAKRSSVHPGNTAVVTAGIIIADVVGSGILSLANAVAYFGWLPGSVLLVLVMAMNMHISMLMWRAKMRHPAATTYAGLVNEVFREAPTAQRRVAVSFTGVSQQASLFGSAGLYLLSLGKGLGMLFYDLQVCLPIWACLGLALVLFATGNARSMGTCRGLLLLNIVTILGSVGIPLIVMAMQGIENSRPYGSRFEAWDWSCSFQDAMSGLSTYTWACTSQTILVEIMAEMQDPSELPRAYLNLSGPFQLLLFLLIGLGGYYLKGTAMTGMIMDNLAFGSAFRLAALCLVLHMLVVCQIGCVAQCRYLHKVVHPQSAEHETRMAWSVWYALVLMTGSLAWLISQVAPFFTDLMDLMGALFGGLNCQIIPVLTYLKSVWFDGRRSQRTQLLEEPDDSCGESTSESTASSRSAFEGPQSRLGRLLEGFAMAAELLFSVVLVIFGTWDSYIRITQKWQTYGYPFDCHCEGLWDTCACSRGHAGLDTCTPEQLDRDM